MPGGIGVNTRWLGWGVAFLDFDNDAWLDLLLVNGHVYPEVRQIEIGSRLRAAQGRLPQPGQRPVRGPDAPVSARRVTIAEGRRAAPPSATSTTTATSTCVVHNVHDTPGSVPRSTGDRRRGHWIALKLVGTASNRNAIGARVHIAAGGTEQRQEVRGGGSYLSQNDLRVHFGLAGTTVVDRLDVRWPNGLEERWEALAAGKLHTLTEGTGK